ncbi:MAG: hypothetical protein OEM62_02625 [Acidobacteriota bacterium]|nr:hypothetical protein [Acidobacteriota bacterium]
MTAQKDQTGGIDYSRYFDRETHLWVKTMSREVVRCGFDPLGAETSGDIVAVSFEPPGTRIERGAAFGSIEAAKFVGPLLAPVSGSIIRHNHEVAAEPGLINADPQAHWMIEIEPDALDVELGELLHGEEAVREWFAAERKKFEHEGLLAT